MTTLTPDANALAIWAHNSDARFDLQSGTEAAIDLEGHQGSTSNLPGLCNGPSTNGSGSVIGMIWPGVNSPSRNLVAYQSTAQDVLAALVASRTWTVSAWVYLDALESVAKYFFSYDTSGISSFSCGVHSTGTPIVAFDGGGFNFVQGSGTVPLGTWFHYAVEFTPNGGSSVDVELFVDGVSRGGGTYTAPSTSTFQRVRVGAQFFNTVAPRPWPGRTGPIMLSDNARGAAYHLADVAKPARDFTSDANTVEHWPFQPAPHIEDRSGNGLHLQLTDHTIVPLTIPSFVRPGERTPRTVAGNPGRYRGTYETVIYDPIRTAMQSGAWTLTAWVEYTGETNGFAFAFGASGEDEPTNYQFQLRTRTVSRVFRYFSERLAGVNIDEDSTIAAFESQEDQLTGWQFYVITATPNGSGMDLRFYRNADQVGGVVTTTERPTGGTMSRPLILAGDGGSDQIAGAVDETSIHNVTRDQAWIDAAYEEGRSCSATTPPDTTPPVITFTPEGGEVPARGVIQADATDDVDLASVLILMRYTTDEGEVCDEMIVDPVEGVQPKYAETVGPTPIAGGFRWLLKRAGGWPAKMVLRGYPVDTSGN